MTASTYDYDLVVIGGGLAGHRGAICAAKLRKKVAIIERKWTPGATRFRSGTVPSKTLREAVNGLRQQALYGRGVPQQVTMADLTSRLEAVINAEVEAARARLQRYGIDMLEGEASFIDPHTVRVQAAQASNVVTARNFLIATGTRPAGSAKFQADGKRICNSDQFLSLENIPRELIIIGAGIIGIEYASMLAVLGVKVTVVDDKTALLPFLDRGIVDEFCSRLRQLGVTVRLGEKVAECGIDARQDRVFAKLESGETIYAESLLYAAGRHANTDTLNLKSVGIGTNSSGALEVNDQFQTTVPHIYAAGDVIGFPAEELLLGSISMEQARLASCNMFGYPAISRPQLFPYGIYAIPEMSMLGSTEEQLKKAGVDYEVGIARYGELPIGQILGEDGLLKLLFNPDSLKLLGIHVLGGRATEIIHIGQAVASFAGTIEYFRDAVFNYPTLAEAYRVAALDGLDKVGMI